MDNLIKAMECFINDYSVKLVSIIKMSIMLILV